MKTIRMKESVEYNKSNLPRRWWMSSWLYGTPNLGVDEEHGVIRGVAVVTEGEAKGHGVNLDAEFVERVVKLGNEKRQGVKERFGHPTMSGTALGTFIGRATNFRLDTSTEGRAVARADISLSETAKHSPEGDLYSYILAMAKKEPDMMGQSIVFTPGMLYKRDKDGNKVTEQSREFENLPGPLFVEIESLHAVDMVDDPAANPDGLFSRWGGGTWAAQVSEFLDLHPEIFEYASNHPEVIEQFLARYKEYAERKRAAGCGTIKTEEKSMENEMATIQPETQAAPAGPDVTPVESAGSTCESVTVSDLKRYVERFGEVNGLKWLLEGKSWENCLEETISLLKGEVNELKHRIAEQEKKLKAVQFGENKPVSASHADSAKAMSLEQAIPGVRNAVIK